MATKIKWSKEFSLGKVDIKNAPETGGVFEVRRNSCYCRYKGKTRVLNIGQSRNLRKELTNRLDGRHTTARRLDKIRVGYKVTFRYSETDNPKDLETELLKEFEDKHFDLPVLNAQRGYGRGED